MKPVVGEAAVGHGMSGRVAATPDLQPLAADGIWRVMLEGETLVRVVRAAASDGGLPWRLLAMSDMTEEQLDAYEAAIAGCPGPGGGF